MAKYTITINEEQRNILVSALCDKAIKCNAVANSDEIDLLLGMFTSLTKVDNGRNNQINDFTA